MSVADNEGDAIIASCSGQLDGCTAEFIESSKDQQEGYSDVVIIKQLVHFIAVGSAILPSPGDIHYDRNAASRILFGILKVRSAGNQLLGFLTRHGAQGWHCARTVATGNYIQAGMIGQGDGSCMVCEGNCFQVRPFKNGNVYHARMGRRRQ